MLISRNVFRGYDIRGEYPTDINAEAAEKIGKGFATLMKREGETKIIVGYDIRLSSGDGVLATGEENFSSIEISSCRRRSKSTWVLRAIV